MTAMLELDDVVKSYGHGATAPSGLAERVLANVLSTMGRHEEDVVETLRQVELAYASGDDSRIVHACYMGAIALNSVGLEDDARHLVHRAAAHARKSLSPTDLASAAVARGFTSASDADAVVAFIEAQQIAQSVGNRWMSAFASTEASGVLVAHGDLAVGCTGLADMVSFWYRAGEWSEQWHTLSRCVVALDRIGEHELEMEVVGAIEAHSELGVAPMSTMVQDMLFATRASLLDRLGEDQAATLCAAGAASPVDEIVMRTRRALLGPA